MTNKELILAFLNDIPTDSYCDDCISHELNIRPRQQVNAVARTLFSKQMITRKKGVCSSCFGSKLVNSSSGDKRYEATENKEIKETVAPYQTNPKLNLLNTPYLDIEHERTNIVRMCNEIWHRHLNTPSPRGVAALINDLRTRQFIPNHQANMMLTICSMRNVFVYEDYPLGNKEMEIAKNAISIINEWWSKNGNR